MKKILGIIAFLVGSGFVLLVAQTNYYLPIVVNDRPATETPTMTMTLIKTNTPTKTILATGTPTKTPTSTPTRTPTMASTSTPTKTIVLNCAASYPDFCIPPPPPDLNCSDVEPHKNFTVLWNVPNPDPHHFDSNQDGIGCEN